MPEVTLVRDVAGYDAPDIPKRESNTERVWKSVLTVTLVIATVVGAYVFTKYGLPKIIEAARNVAKDMPPIGKLDFNDVDVGNPTINVPKEGANRFAKSIGKSAQVTSTRPVPVSVTPEKVPIGEPLVVRSAPVSADAIRATHGQILQPTAVIEAVPLTTVTTTSIGASAPKLPTLPSNTGASVLTAVTGAQTIMSAITTLILVLSAL